MGDDATGLLILDRRYRSRHYVPLFAGNAPRIAKTDKPDLEGASIFRQQGKDYLLLVPSFSTANRNRLVILPLDENTSLTPKIINTSLGATGLAALNIEGATQWRQQLILANRANLSSPHNHLLTVSFDVQHGFQKVNRLIAFNLPPTPAVAGVSGLCYVAEKDLLLFTASTELTEDALADGTIGDSYLGLVYNLSGKMAGDSLMADILINITPILKQKEPQKIESVTVQSIRNDQLLLHLAADNDNGTSTLFKLRLDLRGSSSKQ